MKTAVRRVLLMSALLSPTALYALGLGEIRLNSALNQPFDAEIELVSAAEEDLAALRASLASGDTFQRYGLDKPAYLSDFTFRVVRSGGRDVLKVTSPRPVTEPFVTLLVEANWPRGRLLREYTVLLDPPVFAPATVAEPAVAAPRATPAPVRAAPEPRPAPSPAEPPAPRRSAAVAATPGSTYRVRPNDTLWNIASSAYAGSRADVNRAMVAIYEANPSAFGGNINVLRAGSELRMPSTGDVSAISASAAAEEVARQYRLWREGSTEAAAESADGGRLRLVTPEQGSAVPSTATAAAPAGSEALQSRVQQLEQELAEARRLLEVRNAELATLQGSTAPAEAALPAEEAPLPAEEPAAGATEETEAAAAAEAAAATAVEDEPVAEAEPEPAPKPAQAPAAAEPSLLDRILEYWWALVALLLAALGIAAFLRRRSAATTEDDLEEALGRRPDDLRARVAPPPAKEASIVVEERKPVEPVAAKVAPAVAAAAAATPKAPEPSRKPVSIDDTLSGDGPVSIEAGDPLAEADFHMAYGLYDQAADLIQVAAKREPKRRDLKLKLLEIFFVWGNRDRFLELAREMAASRAEGQPGEWDKILIMGRQIAPEDALFAGASAAATDSLDMELGGSDAAVDLEFPEPGDAAAPDVDFGGDDAAAGSEAGLDFVLDEPVRGGDQSALEPTVESPRVKVASEEPTTEVPIEDLGLDVSGLEDLDELTETEKALVNEAAAALDDTVERPLVSADEDDLLSSTSIMSGESVAEAMEEQRAVGEVDLSDATGELPALEPSTLDATGMMERGDFAIEGEAATMSEVGTKLDLARAYIDMGDPEGARSILDEVLAEGNPAQRKEAERLLAGLP